VTRSEIGEPTVVPPSIEDALADELERHKGKWVAIFNGAVVAVADSAAEARDLAQEKSITDPTLFRVPINPNRIAYY